MEKDSVAFYEDLVKVLTAEDAAAVERIVAEERGHVRDLCSVRMTVT